MFINKCNVKDIFKVTGGSLEEALTAIDKIVQGIEPKEDYGITSLHF